MKQLLILIACLTLVGPLYSQNEPERYSYTFVGVRMRTIAGQAYNTSAYALGEIAFGKVASNRFSFQIRGGMDNYRSVNEGHLYINSSQTSTGARAIYTGLGSFIKPAWIFYRNLGKTYTNYISVSINATYAVHTLEIEVDDPVYGRKNNTYQKIVIYPFSSMEIEHSNLLHLGNRVDLNLSYYLGIKFVKPALFDDVAKGFSQKANFVPGVSNGGYVYANLLFGINIHLY